jgi:hypothetical protein
MLAISLDNLLFFLLIAVAALFQLFSKALSKTSKNQPEETEETDEPPTPETPPAVGQLPKESDAERIRKFLEALGQPPTSAPPPPVMPRAEIPPRPLAPVQPPIARAWEVTREEQRKRRDIAKQSPSSGRMQPLEQAARPSTPATRAPAFEVHRPTTVELQPEPIKARVETYVPASPAVAKAADIKTDIAALLASSSGLQHAIVLREIFGPPRGLQACDLF